MPPEEPPALRSRVPVRYTSLVEYKTAPDPSVTDVIFAMPFRYRHVAVGALKRAPEIVII